LIGPTLARSSELQETHGAFNIEVPNQNEVRKYMFGLEMPEK
jgi:hypothetical protein